MEPEINKEFVFNHFARKTSPLQRTLLTQWLQERANEERYYEWLEEWETKHPQYLAPTDTACAQYSAFLERNATDDTATESSPFVAGQSGWFQRSWLIAASILLLGTCAFLVRNQLIYKTYETGFG